MNQFRRLAVLAAGVLLVVSACGGGTPAPSTPAASQPASSEAATAAPSAAPLTGTLTIWHSYGSSGGGTESAEVQGLNEILAWMKTNNPGLTINAINVDFGTMYTNFEQESANGGGPDMFIGPNDNLGNEARGGYLVNLDGKIDSTLSQVSDVAKNGSMAEGHVYMVPESLKAVAMYYDSTKVATPPATTDDLLKFAQGGGKLGVLTGAYFGWGFYSAFGGSILDPTTGKCTATATTGVADAINYVKSLNAEKSAVVDSDYSKINDPFIAGNLDVILNGNWVLSDYKKARPGLAVAPFPSGPKGPGKSMVGVDGWYINAAASDAQQALAIAAAQQMVSAPAEQFMVDKAGHVPANTSVSVTDPLVKAFTAANSAGDPRPQSKQFGNYWGPFGDAWSKSIPDDNSAGGDVTSLVAAACSGMDAANSIAP